MDRVKYLIAILGVVGFLGCSNIVVNASGLEDAKYESFGFIWTPLDSFKMVSSTDSNAMSDVYYCKNDTVRNVYYKKIVEEQVKLAQMTGLSGMSPNDEKLQKAYEAGNCKLITEFKVLTKNSYTCEGIFANGNFLDILYCKTSPETYKKARATGKTNAQMEQVFKKSEQSIINDFKAGKATSK